MIQNFASIARSAKIAYRVDTDAWSINRRGHRLADWAMEFETYGDGMIQHSPEYCVQTENIADFCISLAAFLLKPEGEKLREHLRFKWPEQISRDRLEFFFGLKHDSEKRRWFHSGDLKVSTAPAKDYDKRWERVPDWADQTVKNVARFLTPEHRGAEWLYHYRVLLEAYHFSQKDSKLPWSPTPEAILEIDPEARGPFEAVCAVIEGYQRIDYAQRVVNSITQRVNKKGEAAA